MFVETADIETASAEYASRFNGAVGEFFLKKQTEVVLSLLKDLPKAKILDVGGGHAQLAEPLVKNGFDVTVTGSDASCRNRLLQRISRVDFEYKTCDLLKLPFEDNSFDVVMAFGLLSQVGHWRELLAELLRVAKDCVLFDYPDRRSANIMYNQFFDMKKKLEGDTRPFHLYSRNEIAAELRLNGFQKPLIKPQFFCPMVIHRKVNSQLFSSCIETCSRVAGLTRCFGSPIIMRSNRTG